MMTKAELTARILDVITDPCPESYADISTLDLLTLISATEYLAEIRRGEDEMELEQDERLPKEVSPALLMEVYNCWVRKARHEMLIHHFANWINKDCPICVYDSCKEDYLDDPLTVLPTDFLADDGFPFPTDEEDDESPLFLIELGKRSPEFNPDHEYCWYDKKRKALFSSDNPFADGILDAESMARYFIEDASEEDFTWLVSEMDEDDMYLVFGTADINELKNNRKGIWGV